MSALHSVKLQPAQATDAPYAEQMYVATMQPLLAKLNAWDEAYYIKRFRRAFRPEESFLVIADDARVGWLQVIERANDLNVGQIHIERHACGRGYGSQILRDIQQRARQLGKTVSLAVVKGNRAINLYQRLDFKTTREDATRVHMVWQPPSADPDQAGWRQPA